MGAVSKFLQGWSVSRLALEFALDRRTCSKRLHAAGVQPCGQRDQYAVYELRSAALALLRPTAPVTDPDQLSPMLRRAHFQALNERIKFRVSASMLIPADEAAHDFAQFVHLILQPLDDLPGVLARDVHLNVEQVAAARNSCARIRRSLLERLASLDCADSLDTEVTK